MNIKSSPGTLQTPIGLPATSSSKGWRPELSTIPGVRSSTFTETALPPYIGFNTDFRNRGAAKTDRQRLRVGLIGPHYFETVGIPVLQGRLLTEAESFAMSISLSLTRSSGNDIFHPAPALWAREFTYLESKSASPISSCRRKAISGLRWLAWPPLPAIAACRISRTAIYIPYKMVTVPGATFLLKTDVDPLSIARAARERVSSVAVDLPLNRSEDAARNI